MAKLKTSVTAKICCICQHSFTEYGNNAHPVNEGRCCNDCDNLVVIPARIAIASGQRVGIAGFAMFKEPEKLSTGDDIAILWSKRTGQGPTDGWCVCYVSKVPDMPPVRRLAFIMDGERRYRWSMPCD